MRASTTPSRLAVKINTTAIIQLIVANTAMENVTAKAGGSTLQANVFST